ncbi:MAG: hypothetical protein HPY89_12280 [Pelotomaculum sp.]|uniref:Uncharacterized protein n=1 Tax=Pelotomaculum thermopropionicum (strain DSM 13744 / JCM 10971 / SI) TaxID=370438 RepID=A5D3Z3_PELTS|nr:hypothetical protein [Pelotomaculum sp.]BAF59036.1 hypothetical protein PTH_0855 [Pelotomaculum thermopropionicum SI]
MAYEREYVHIEVNGHKYLYSIWYGRKELLWYGEQMDTSDPLKLVYAVSREGLMKKIKMVLSAKDGQQRS